MHKRLFAAAPVTVSARCGVEEGSVRDALDVEALSHRYGAMVLRRCRRLLRDEDDALDACQDVFVRVLERRERLDGLYPSSLLYRIATNVCLNRIRDQRAAAGDAGTKRCCRRSRAQRRRARRAMPG